MYSCLELTALSRVRNSRQKAFSW